MNKLKKPPELRDQPRKQHNHQCTCKVCPPAKYLESIHRQWPAPMQHDNSQQAHQAAGLKYIEMSYTAKARQLPLIKTQSNVLQPKDINLH